MYYMEVKYERSLIMKKTIFILMILVGTLTLAGQAGYYSYRYTQRDYSNASEVETDYSTRMSRGYEPKETFVTGQPGYDAYRYTQGDYSNAVKVETDYSTRMSRGYEPKETFVTGQPGYAEYNYTQKNYSNVKLEN